MDEQPLMKQNVPMPDIASEHSHQQFFILPRDARGRELDPPRPLLHPRLLLARVRERERRAPASAEDLPLVDAQLDAEPLNVSIDAQARLYLNLGASDDQALSMETVKQRVATVLKRNPEKAVMVWGDSAVPYGEVVVLMSELQDAGAPSVGLVTEAPARR